MKVFENILIEKTELIKSIATYIPIELNHDPMKLIGEAINVRITKGGIFCDMHIKGSPQAGTYFPSIKYEVGEMKLLGIGLCSNRNQDETILPIEIK